MPGHFESNKGMCPAIRILAALGSFHPERVLFRPGAVGPPAELATAYGGGRRGLAGSITDLDAPRGGTGVRLRETPRFPCRDEKCLLSKSETASLLSGVSRWRLGR